MIGQCSGVLLHGLLKFKVVSVAKLLRDLFTYQCQAGKGGGGGGGWGGGRQGIGGGFD